jgi:ketosteroid isomerase-like protein
MTRTLEVEEFLGAMLPRQLEAEQALCRGEVEPWAHAWSRTDPVTLLGAAVPVRRGWDEAHDTFHRLARRFSALRAYDFELLAAGASGDLAYTVGLEHKTVVADGEPATYTLRLTHAYRREDGVWKIVHRHGDRLAPERSAS